MAEKTLTEFLIENPVDDICKEVVISERLKDYKFKIKICSPENFNGYCQTCRKIDNKGKKLGFDDTKFSELIVINHTLYPDFTDAKDIKAAKCNSPREYVNKVLNTGELMALQSKITDLSGLGEDFDDLVKEVKN